MAHTIHHYDSPLEHTVAMLDRAIVEDLAVECAGRRWRFEHCGGWRYYIATELAPRRVGGSILRVACHVAVDGSLRCSGDGVFGEFFPGNQPRSNER